METQNRPVAYHKYSISELKQLQDSFIAAAAPIVSNEEIYREYVWLDTPLKNYRSVHKYHKWLRDHSDFVFSYNLTYCLDIFDVPCFINWPRLLIRTIAGWRLRLGR